MAKPKIPNQRKANLEHKKRTERYAQLIQQVYDRVAQEAARLASIAGADPSRPFSFSDYPLTKEAVKRLQLQLMSDVRGIVMAGTSAEWKESNLIQDLVARKVLKAYTGTTKSGDEFIRYFQTNPAALEAFQQRKDEGMDLSKRVWNLSEQYKEELEEAITAAIAPGTSAMELAAEVKKYLKEPDKRFRRIKEKLEDGTIKWHLSNPAKQYHPGRGVYRSSARNAQRLARTEINMAYRSAEQERWKQFDFVVGYEVKTTKNGHHIEDICDRLAGKYPKDFKFRGWHPQCMCYCIPILKTEEEFWAYDPENPQKSENEITELPTNFREWVDDNRERIEAAEKRGKLPYFIRDNREDVEEILNPKEHKKTPLEIAAERHAARTQEDIERIQSAWNNKLMHDLFEQSDRIGSYRNAEFRDLAKLLEDDNTLQDFSAFKQDYKLAKKYLHDKIEADTEFVREFLNDNANIDNMRELAKVLGIEYKEPMTFFEADELRGNPNYKANEIYRINCQTCVVAHELRRRGFDIQALGNTKGSWLEKLSRATNEIWRDEDGNIPQKQKAGGSYFKPGKSKLSTKTLKQTKTELSELTDSPGRYHIDWGWKQKRKGHIIIFERLPDGESYFYDPQTGNKYSSFPWWDKVSPKYGINVLRVDNLRVDADWAGKILEKSGGKAKSGLGSNSNIAGADIKADVADYVKRRNIASSNKERVILDKEMIKNGGFIRSDHHSTAKGSIFATEELPKKISKDDLELSKNIQMARKMANNGYDCYLLSNPHSTKSADFIFVKDDKVYYTEGKLSTGKNSLDHNLSKGKTQAERVLIDLTNTRDTNYISSQLEKAFEENDSLKEVMLLKGGRLISIIPRQVERKDFKQYFKKVWEQKK